ncbi:hypothetical protein D049_1547A, partial [Vibrio parahaemolyticus VPTS-2010]
MASSREY